MIEVHEFCIGHGDHTYVFRYTRQRRHETLRTVGRFASSTNLNFDWVDARAAAMAVKAQLDSPSLEDAL